MVYKLQQFLSPRPLQRTKSIQDDAVVSAGEDILYEFPTHQGHRAVRETHYLSKKSVRDGKSGPPLYVIPWNKALTELFPSKLITPHSHIHLRQVETFEVEQGVLGVVKNGVEHAIRKEDGPVSIEPGTRYNFSHS